MLVMLVPSVPARGMASRESRERRIQTREMPSAVEAVKARVRPSGETARTLPKVPVGGGATLKRTTGAGAGA